MKARLTKAEFHNIMERLIKKYKKSEEWIDKVDAAFPRSFETIYENDFLEIVIDILEQIVNDTNKWIKYFLYEKNCEWFEYEINGETMYVKSYDDLYDLIVGDDVNE